MSPINASHNKDIFKTRDMQESDFTAILNLARSEGWYCDEEEFRYIHRNNPDGCFTATCMDKIVGCVMSCTHDRTGWIANLVVHPPYRDMGIGTALFERAMDSLKSSDTIYLTASPDGKQIYEKFGFTAICDVLRWQGHGSRSYELEIQPAAQSLQSIDDMVNLDTLCWGDDRSAMLLSKESERWGVGTDLGFLMVGKMSESHIIGPWEVRNGDVTTALQLFHNAIAAIGGEIVLDVPARNVRGIMLLKYHRFKIIGKTSFMQYGLKKHINFDNIFAFASMGSMG